MNILIFTFWISMMIVWFAGCGEEEAEKGTIVNTSPAEGSTIEPNGTLTVTFDNPVEAVTAARFAVQPSPDGLTWTLKGQSLKAGDLTVDINWKNKDGTSDKKSIKLKIRTETSGKVSEVKQEKETIKVSVTGGTIPQVSWDGDKVVMVLVGKDSSIRAFRIDGDNPHLFTDPFAWVLICFWGANCISSPVTYRVTPPEAIDFLAMGQEGRAELFGEKPNVAASLQPGQEYMAAVYRKKPDGTFEKGTKAFKP